MLIIDDGSAWLEDGETIPAFCPCGRVYAPGRGSEASDCPACGRVNVHGAMRPVTFARLDGGGAGEGATHA